MKGILVINKNKGVTSSQVVIKIKKMLNLKKVGHMGTLDPLASGVLLIGVGKATRLFNEFLNKKKRYLATFKFGEQTDTLDLEGKIVKTSSNIPSTNQVLNILSNFLGVNKQLPPEFSSKKINGKRAYDLIRNGKEVKLNPSRIEIFDLSLIEETDKDTFVFDITCSAGTYIRSIARDMGEILNSCATMINLKRIECGNFNLNQALNLEEETSETLKNKIIPLEQVLQNYEKIELSNEELINLLNGKIIKIQNKDLLKKYCLMHKGEVVGICKIDSNNILKVETYLYN